MQFLDVEEPATVQLQNQNRTRPEGPRLPGCLPACFYLFKALCTDECVKTALVAALVSREIEAFIKYMYIYIALISIYIKKIYINITLIYFNPHSILSSTEHLYFCL